jgi:hypothetical protein
MVSNPNIQVSDNGGTLTSDGGNVLLEQFFQAPAVKRAFAGISITDNRRNPLHSNEQIIKQLLIQIIEGYTNDSDANFLAKDVEHSLVFGQLASQPTLSRWFNTLAIEDIAELERLNQRFVSLIDQRHDKHHLVLDLDSTYFEAFGHQEGIAFNYHYLNIGFHPLIMTDALTHTVRSAKLRPGNTYTGNGAHEFVTNYLDNLDTTKYDTILLRGDSGFANPVLLDELEARDIKYVIRLKGNARLKRMAIDERYVNVNHILAYDGRLTTDEMPYAANSWSQERRVIIVNNERGDHQFLVTNLALPQLDVVKIYRKRATIEEQIRELKQGYNFGKTNSTAFIATEARMWLSIIASNLMNLMKLTTMTSAQQSWTITPIRDRILKIGGRVIKHARRFKLMLDDKVQHIPAFWHIWDEISALY